MQPVRGTHDLLPDEYRRFAHVVEAARDVARLYGYREMATPIFEFTELFAPRHRRDDRRRLQGDVHVPGSRRRIAHPAAGIYRRHLPRLRVQRRAQPAAAAQALRRRPDVPLRAPAEGPPAAVPPDRPRGAGRPRGRRRYRGDLGGRRHPRPAGHPRPLRAQAQFPGRSREPHGLSQGPGRLLFRPHREAFRGFAEPPAAQSAAHPRQQRTRATRRSMPTRRPSPIT